MAAWEYRVLTVSVMDIGDAIKHRDKRAMLDPEMSDSEWMRKTFKFGRQDASWVVEAPDGHWTVFGKGLSLWGAKGWELAASTPPEILYYGGNQSDYRYSSYCLILKRESGSGQS